MSVKILLLELLAFIFTKLFYSCLCVGVFCLHVCLCTMCMPCALGSQRVMGNPLDLGLQMVVSYCVDTGNRTLVLWKSSWCFWLLRHFSSSSLHFDFFFCFSVLICSWHWVYFACVWFTWSSSSGLLVISFDLVWMGSVWVIAVHPYTWHCIIRHTSLGECLTDLDVSTFSEPKERTHCEQQADKQVSKH